MSCAVKIVVVAFVIEAMKMLEKFGLDTTVSSYWKCNC